MIPTVPPEPVFWQGLVHGDYFQTSVTFGAADIYMVVGGISEIRNHFLPVIAN